MTGLLLDTHAFVWTILQPQRLSGAAYQATVSPDLRIFVSAVSVYEIEYKRPREPLFNQLPSPFWEIADRLEMGWLPISLDDAEVAGRLDRDHRDPWDRLLAAQATNRSLTLVTADERIHQIASSWQVEFLW